LSGNADPVGTTAGRIRNINKQAFADVAEDQEDS
jgi:hypothetical protein